MRLTRLLALCCLAAGLIGCREGESATYRPAEGDVIFQSFPPNPLTLAIEGITQSGYSHCGLVHFDGQRWVVVEAVGPVQETPLSQWIERGRGERYAAFRLNGKYRKNIPAMMGEAGRLLGRPYDIHYRFGDNAIYCSELVFDAFKAATGEDLGKVQTLGDLHWRDHVAFIKQIEGGKVPLDRRMITPVSLSEASQLHRVYSNYR